MRTYLKFTLLALALLFPLACSLSSLPNTPTVQSTPTEVAASSSPTSIPSLVPRTPTAAALPSPTTSPSPAPLAPTDTPAPSGLNASGPYVLFKGQGGTWITNPDGSFPTRISEFEVKGDLRRAISPAGDRMAIVVSNDQGLDLVLVKIPGGETETIAHLIRSTPAEIGNATSPKAFATYAIRDYDSVAWQPGAGRLLAFIGAINGPSADLYLYDIQTRAITQLTDGPSQAVLPVWSPGGQYILHYGVSWVPPFGGAIGGANRLDGVWAVQVSDGRVITMPKPKGILPNFVGWQDDSHYLTYDSDDQCYSQNLRSVDVASGKTTPILDSSFYFQIARSSENGALLFPSTAGCKNSLGEGIFILLPGQTTPTKVFDKKAYEVYWMPESKVFFAYPEALFASDGNTRYDPPVYDASFLPAVSKNGYQAWEVIQNRKGQVMLKIPGGEWQTIFSGMVDRLIWDPIDGRTLLIALEDGSLYAATYPNFTPRLMGSLDGRVSQAIWLP